MWNSRRRCGGNVCRSKGGYVKKDGKVLKDSVITCAGGGGGGPSAIEGDLELAGCFVGEVLGLLGVISGVADDKPCGLRMDVFRFSQSEGSVDNPSEECPRTFGLPRGILFKVVNALGAVPNGLKKGDGWFIEHYLT